MAKEAIIRESLKTSNRIKRQKVGGDSCGDSDLLLLLIAQQQLTVLSPFLIPTDQKYVKVR